MNELIGVITDPNTALILCLVFIVGDIISGYLKAWKNNTLNSSVSRDGYIKKLGWFLGLALGYVINEITGMNAILLTTAGICIVTEFISVLENLSEIGVDLKKLGEHLEKVDNKEEK